MQIDDYSEPRSLSPEETLSMLSWKIVADQWRLSKAAEGWIPSDLNLLLLIDKIEMLGLADVPAERKCAALTTAFDELKREGGLQSVVTLN